MRLVRCKSWCWCLVNLKICCGLHTLLQERGCRLDLWCQSTFPREAILSPWIIVFWRVALLPPYLEVVILLCPSSIRVKMIALLSCSTLAVEMSLGFPPLCAVPCQRFLSHSLLTFSPTFSYDFSKPSESKEWASWTNCKQQTQTNHPSHQNQGMKIQCLGSSMLYLTRMTSQDHRITVC